MTFYDIIADIVTCDLMGEVGDQMYIFQVLGPFVRMVKMRHFWGPL